MRVWAVALVSVALLSGVTELGWLVVAGTAVAGAVVGALVGTVWSEDSERSCVRVATLGGAAGAVLLVGLPLPVLAVLVVTSAAVWTPWRRARRSGWSPSPRRPATR